MCIKHNANNNFSKQEIAKKDCLKQLLNHLNFLIITQLYYDKCVAQAFMAIASSFTKISSR